ncbi:exonuclease domain-containing protein [Calidifontibacillus oryziterrae]|uniref:exonuclease domain-containing protein n=1 Tax=Calidifontibacillus oryziterrae TaxID=1191699 RepID=UPI0002D78A52|nr:exonuclease domain-containing protein [Calidifontibacillus oryziterrae]
MRIDPFIQWMKQVHGRVNSALYGQMTSQNSQQIAFLRSLEKEMEREKSLYTPLQELEVVVFDFETTGFYPERGDQILSIGAVKLKGWVMNNEAEETFYSLVQFNGSLSNDIKQLTGLGETELKDAPPLLEVLVQFYQFVQGRTLVAHHASHEKKFLQQANWKLFKTNVKHRIVDTSLVFNVATPHEKLITLEDYCQHCGIEVQNRHHALGDAKMTAQLWRLYLKILHDMKYKTLSDIYECF